MKNNLDQIYEGSVFGKPSIHLDPFDAPPASNQQKLSERQAVINTYLPERFHVKTNNTTQKHTSLREKHSSKKVDPDMVTFLESYFSTDRMNKFNGVEQILEDMYSFLKENQG